MVPQHRKTRNNTKASLSESTRWVLAVWTFQNFFDWACPRGERAKTRRKGSFASDSKTVSCGCYPSLTGSLGYRPQLGRSRYGNPVLDMTISGNSPLLARSPRAILESRTIRVGVAVIGQIKTKMIESHRRSFLHDVNGATKSGPVQKLS